MFDEERCPYCECGDYSVDNYEEDYKDDYFTREWICTCTNCKAPFVITYLYELENVKVSKS